MEFLITYEELIELCKLYKGEQDNPYDSKLAFIWEYERAWVLEISRNNIDVIKEYLADYKAYGLKSFSANDGVPMTLKALLFNRYAKGGYSMADEVEPFKNFYVENYLTLN